MQALAQNFNLNVTPWSSSELTQAGQGQFIIPQLKIHRSSMVELICGADVAATNAVYCRADSVPVQLCTVQKDSQTVANLVSLQAAQSTYYWNNMQDNQDIFLSSNVQTTYSTQKKFKRIKVGTGAGTGEYSIFMPIHQFLPHILFGDNDVCQIDQQLTVTLNFGSFTGNYLFSKVLDNATAVQGSDSQEMVAVNITKLRLQIHSKVIVDQAQYPSAKHLVYQISYACNTGSSSYTPLWAVPSDQILINQQLSFLLKPADSTGITFDEPSITALKVTCNGYQLIQAADYTTALRQFDFSLQGKDQCSPNNFMHEYKQLYNNCNVTYNFQVTTASDCVFYITYVLLKQ